MKRILQKNFVAGFKSIRYNKKVKTSLLQIVKLLFGNRAFALIVVIPTIIYFLYSSVIATPRYESVATIAIKDNHGGGSLGGLGVLLGEGASSSTNLIMLQSYIKSLNMLNVLNNNIKILSLYKNNKIDFISRLSSNADQEGMLTYYLHYININIDQDAQSISISAQGVSPEEAQTITQGIVDASQSFINNIDLQLATQRLQFAQKQVEISQKKLFAASKEIINFQNSNSVIDPKSEVILLSGILASLESQLVQSQIMLVNMGNYLQENSPDIERQKEKILSLQQQIEIEKQKIIGVDGKPDSQLNTVVNKFELLRLNAQVAVSEYAAAIASLEIAKTDTIKQKQQVVVLMPPTLPDYHKYPRTLYNTITLFMVLLTLYGILKMIKTLIDEHRY